MLYLKTAEITSAQRSFNPLRGWRDYNEVTCSVALFREFIMERWRSSVCEQLLARNRAQTDAFRPLIASYAALLHKCNQLEREIKLKVIKTFHLRYRARSSVLRLPFTELYFLVYIYTKLNYLSFMPIPLSIPPRNITNKSFYFHRRLSRDTLNYRSRNRNIVLIFFNILIFVARLSQGHTRRRVIWRTRAGEGGAHCVL